MADGTELLVRLAQIRKRMARIARERLTRAQISVDALKRGVLQRDGEKLLRESVMRLDSARGQLSQAVKLSLETLVRRVNELRASHKGNHPAKVLERRTESVTHLGERLERASKDSLTRRLGQIDRLRVMLRTLGPESAFQRGFSITLGADGKIITSAAALKPGDLLRTKFADGEATSEVLPV